MGIVARPIADEGSGLRNERRTNKTKEGAHNTTPLTKGDAFKINPMFVWRLGAKSIEPVSPELEVEIKESASSCSKMNER